MLNHERLEHIMEQAQEAVALSPDLLLHTAQHEGINGVYQLGLKHMAEYLYDTLDTACRACEEKRKAEVEIEEARQVLDTNIRKI